MPLPVTTSLPVPKSWDEFEDIVADVLKLRWCDPNVTRNGRSGQRQHGVDIYGLAAHLPGRYAGAQCKNYSERLSVSALQKEVQNAGYFQPPLAEFVVATTSRRDTRLQESVRLMNMERLPKGLFSVHLLFWEDLCLELSGDPRLVAKYFGEWSRKASAEVSPTISVVWALGDERPAILELHSQPKLIRIDLALRRFEEEEVGYIAVEHPDQAAEALEYNRRVAAAATDAGLLAKWLESKAGERFEQGLSVGVAVSVNDAEARDIVVELEFPPELEVWRRSAPPSRIEGPTLPVRPRLRALEYENPLGAATSVAAMIAHAKQLSLESVALPVLRLPRRGCELRVRGRRARFTIGRLAPRRELAFEGEGEEIVIAARTARSDSLVSYSVDAANLPQPLKGELKVRVTPGANPIRREEDE